MNHKEIIAAFIDWWDQWTNSDEPQDVGDPPIEEARRLLLDDDSQNPCNNVGCGSCHQHTPGPWKISNYRPYNIIARDPAESTYEVGDDKFTPFASAFGENREANASLIAKAWLIPEYEEVLKLVIALGKDRERFIQSQISLDDCVSAARAALAAAGVEEE